MADIAQVCNAEPPHVIDKNRVGDLLIPGSPLTWDIGNGDIFHLCSYGIPSLLQGNPSEDKRVSGDGFNVIVGVVIVAYGHCIGLDSGSNIEIRVCNDFGLAPGLD